ncbi:MAG: transposase [Daejeonella sp.]|nr:transposase [Daejeonella sp.]
MEPVQKQMGLADVFRQFEECYYQRYSLCPDQHKAFQCILHCRSIGMGMHLSTCDACGHQQIGYNSCRNRHCPQCQYTKQLLWVEKLKQKLLPVRYFHIVFTVPEFFNPLFYINQRSCYDLLFKASGLAMGKVTANPAFLGAQSGHVSILHTWGQNLSYHPHIHMLVPAGGLDSDGMQWIRSAKKFFVPVKALSDIFRGVFMGLLKKAILQGHLKVPEKELALYADMAAIKTKAYLNNWHVYIKKTFKGAGQVVSYLGRYTHRVAISNNRLLAIKDGIISFRWKDYRDNQSKVMQLDGICFIRRFLQHILPCGFYKIRYYGILASVNTNTKMKQCFVLLGLFPPEPFVKEHALTAVMWLLGKNNGQCPVCGKGRMHWRPVELKTPG